MCIDSDFAFGNNSDPTIEYNKLLCVIILNTYFRKHFFQNINWKTIEKLF